MRDLWFRFIPILVAALCWATSSHASAAAFSDVQGGLYGPAVAELSAYGIIQGYPDGTFRPNKPITRAEAVALVLKAGQVKVNSPSIAWRPRFSDVSKDHWAYGPIEHAAAIGMVEGAANGRFEPDRSVSYTEILTMLLRFLEYQNEARKAGPWPHGYIQVAEQVGLVLPDEFAYPAAATRGDVALILQRAFSKVPSGTTGLTLLDRRRIAQGDGYLLLNVPTGMVYVDDSIPVTADIIITGSGVHSIPLSALEWDYDQLRLGRTSDGFVARAAGKAYLSASAYGITQSVVIDIQQKPTGLTCKDFDTWDQAQRFYERLGGPDRDPLGLDPDGNGIACENLLTSDQGNKDKDDDDDNDD